MWQMPESGRLVGMLVSRPDITQSDSALLFEDIRGVRWEVSDSELTLRETNLLMNNTRVRLLGTSTAPGVFHVCGVFPWMFERPMARSEMERERAEFDARMMNHKRMQSDDSGRPSPQMNGTSSESSDDADISNDKICAHLQMMGRMR